MRVILSFFKRFSVSPIPGSTSVKVSRLFKRILLDIICARDIMKFSMGFWRNFWWIFFFKFQIKTILTNSVFRISNTSLDKILFSSCWDSLNCCDGSPFYFCYCLRPVIITFLESQYQFFYFWSLDWRSMGLKLLKKDFEMISWWIFSSKWQVGHRRLWSF